MKKLLVSAVLLLVMEGLFAQLGINAGLNLSNVNKNGNNLSDHKMKVGFHVGASYLIPVSDVFLVQPDIMYSQEGSQASDFDSKFNMDFVFLSVLARYNIKNGLYAATGPGYGYLLSSKEKYDGGINDWMDFQKRSNLIWSLMGGYDLKNNLGFYIRYNHGLLSLFKYDENGDAPGGIEKTRSFQIGVRYTFELNKK